MSFLVLNFNSTPDASESALSRGTHCAADFVADCWGTTLKVKVGPLAAASAPSAGAGGWVPVSGPGPSSGVRAPSQPAHHAAVSARSRSWGRGRGRGKARVSIIFRAEGEEG